MWAWGFAELLQKSLCIVRARVWSEAPQAECKDCPASACLSKQLTCS